MIADSPNPSLVDLSSVASKIREAVRRIEEDCRVGGPRCNEENVKSMVEGILRSEVWNRLALRVLSMRGSNEEEAYYLTSILNSSFIDELIKPMQSRGQYGPRHIHKKPLELAIPKYELDNGLHRELAELGRDAARRANKLLPDLLKKFGYDARLKSRGYLTPQEVGRLRSAVRDALEDLLSRINELVI